MPARRGGRGGIGLGRIGLRRGHRLSRVVEVPRVVRIAVSERFVEEVAQLLGVRVCVIDERLRLWKDRPRVREGLELGPRNWHRVPVSNGGLLNVGGEVQSGIRGRRGVIRRRGRRRGRPAVGGLHGRAERRRFGLVRRKGRGWGPVSIVRRQWRGEIWHFGVAVRIGLSVM